MSRHDSTGDHPDDKPEDALPEPAGAFLDSFSGAVFAAEGAGPARSGTARSGTAKPGEAAAGRGGAGTRPAGDAAAVAAGCHPGARPWRPRRVDLSDVGA